MKWAKTYRFLSYVDGDLFEGIVFFEGDAFVKGLGAFVALRDSNRKVYHYNKKWPTAVSRIVKPKI